VVTAAFRPQPSVVPGKTYWIVLDNASPGHVWWNIGLQPNANSTNAQFIVDGNGSRWFGYSPGAYLPTAMRVIASAH
jgi:hypothetical protein